MAAKGLLKTQPSGLVAKIETGIGKTVPQQYQADYQWSVRIGLQLLFDKDAFYRMLHNLESNGERGKGSAALAISISMILMHIKKMKLEPAALIPAGQVIMMHVLDYFDKAGIEPITNESVAQSTTRYMEGILPIFGITKARLQKFLEGGAQVMQHPKVIAGMKEAANGVA